jgi:hypothetical protein
VIIQDQRLKHVTGHVESGNMKATDLNLSEMPAMTLHGPDGFGLTQYSGDEYALVGGFRDGSSNAGELRLKYQIYSHALIDANNGDFAKGEIGYCVVRVASDDGPDQGDILGLIDIELKPKYRKSGHGKKIVRDIVDTTKSGNLDIHDIQKKAKKFWDKMGVEYKSKQTGSAQNAVLKKQTESIDIASVAEIAKMAAVAGLAAPVMMAMIKAAYKTGKGINAIRKIANRAGVKLADRVMGEEQLPSAAAGLRTGVNFRQGAKASGPVSTATYNQEIGALNRSKTAIKPTKQISMPGRGVAETIDDFNKDEPNKSTVEVPGYGTMNVDSLMKNVINQTTQMVKQMQSGAQGFRNADYALNSNKVLPTKVAALVKALDDLQAIRAKGGANSRNIQQEAEEEQQQLPVDVNKIMGNIQEFESKEYVSPQDADLMRRGVQSLATPRQTVNPQAILQLLTMVTR